MSHKYETEQAFLEAAKTRLDQGNDALDDLTLMRLRQMRNKALQAMPDASSAPASNIIALREQWWMPVTSIAATLLIAVLGFHMATQMTHKPVSADDMFSSTEDMQILGADQSLDFYKDIEFYQWLDEQKDLG